LQPFSDEQLIESCLEGRQGHCRLIYDRYHKLVASQIWNFFKDIDITEELTQEVFVKAFNSLKKFRGESSMKTWLARITLNCCYDRLRKQERKREKQHDSLNHTDEGRGPEFCANEQTANPERNLLQRELEEVLAEALRQLPKKQSSAILLVKDGFSYAEIADVLEIPDNSVPSLVYNAKVKMRGLLTPYMEGANP
jgi:RNA polymerase sigma-70 factor (ECF subfamily)